MVKLMEKMMKPYNELFVRDPQVVPGVFRCRGCSGLRVEVVGTRFGRTEILIGDPEIAKPIFVDSKAAAILRDFFGELAGHIK